MNSSSLSQFSTRIAFFLSIALYLFGSGPADAQVMACPGAASFPVTGPIADRWSAAGGSQGGALGCVTGAAQTQADGSVVQTFDNGQIAFSPHQGTAMTVALYQLGSDLVFEWGETAPYHYDAFLLRVDKDGVNVGQWTDNTSQRTGGIWNVPLPSAGDYQVVVEGCDSGTFSSSCKQSWTFPVHVYYKPVQPFLAAYTCPVALSPGPIHDRYVSPGTLASRIGCPTGAAAPIPGGRAIQQTFDHGQIVFDPDRGSAFTLAAYQAEDDIIVEWGSTAPFHYDAFNVLWSKDGQAAPQVEIDPDQTTTIATNGPTGATISYNRYGNFNRAVYSIRGIGPGTYQVQVEGCDKHSLSSSTCHQGWSAPAVVNLTLTAAYNTTCNLERFARNPTYAFGRGMGVVLDLWSRLVGPNGPLLGCPHVVGSDLEDSRIVLTFDYGQIAWSAQQGADMAVAVWKEIDSTDSSGQPVAYNLNVMTGDTFPYSYDKLLLRVNSDQSDQTTSDGSHITGLLEPIRYGGQTYQPGNSVTVVLEGCDSHFASSSSCKQGWTQPATWTFVPMIPGVAPSGSGAEFTFTLSPSLLGTSVFSAAQSLGARGVAAATFAGCRKTLGVFFWVEQDFGKGALAELEMADANMDLCLPPASGISPTSAQRPWHQLDEVNAAMRFQQQQSKPGTTTSKCGRTGEYDVIMARLVPMLFRFGRELDNDVHSLILNGLLSLRGPYDPGDRDVCNSTLPIETENHLLNMETSRFLTNQALYALTGDATYNNETNGTTAYMLSDLGGLLADDFNEYNSKTYQGYSLFAVQNLADYATDRRVKTAARMVLDFSSAKFSLSSIGLRRNAPYRRHPGDYPNDSTDKTNVHILNGFNSDSQTGRFTLYTGLFQQLYDPTTTQALSKYLTGNMIEAFAGNYRPPRSVLYFMLEPKSPTFFERIHHAGIEIYSGTSQYLISAGGEPTAELDTIAGNGSFSDSGASVITSLTSAGAETKTNQQIRFDGTLASGGEAGIGTDGLASRNVETCVGPRVACGVNLIIPSPYVPASCIQRQTSCALRSSTPGGWTFVNHSTSACNTSSPQGDFYVAAFNASATAPTQDVHGLFEVYPVQSAGKSFSEFVQSVCDNNPAIRPNGTTPIYSPQDGEQVLFQSVPLETIPGMPLPTSGQLQIGASDDVTIAHWPLASGSHLNSDETKKQIVFHEPMAPLTLTPRLQQHGRTGSRPKPLRPNRESSLVSKVPLIGVPLDSRARGLLDFSIGMFLRAP